MSKIESQLIKKDHPDYKIIADYIHSKDSVVGIDAWHTHVVIIKKLIELEEKLDKLLAPAKAKKKIVRRKSKK